MAVPRRALSGRLNALSDRYPKLVAEWDRARNGDVTPRSVSVRSPFKAWWKCSVDADHTWRAAVSDRSRGTGCPQCARERNGTPLEALISARFEGTRDNRAQVRIKLGAGGGLNQHFGAAEWRVIVGVELFGQRVRERPQ